MDGVVSDKQLGGNCMKSGEKQGLGAKCKGKWVEIEGNEIGTTANRIAEYRISK